MITEHDKKAYSNSASASARNADTRSREAKLIADAEGKSEIAILKLAEAIDELSFSVRILIDWVSAQDKELAA